MLDDQGNDISFTKKGMEITGNWGTLPVDVLSDGYRSTLNWVTDFFGWSIYADRFGEPNNDFRGILLLDELEQHLHPIWQRYIVKRLHDQFPKVQFITTTHSPLVAAGVADIDNAKLYRLKVNENLNVDKDKIILSHIKGMRADQVLTSDVFGLVATKSIGSKNDVAKFYELYKKQRNDTEEVEFQKLNDQLKKELVFGETEYKRLVERATRETIDKLLEEKSKEIIPEVLDFEMKRKLREIFHKSEEE